MREIKFRGKNRDGIWYYGFLTIGMDSFFIEERHELPPTMSDPCGDCIVTRESINPESIGEYTGLKDKNGIEIYEGDILKVKNHYGIFTVPVAYNEDGGYFASDNSKAVQIENPKDWKETHDKVNSYGFRLSPYNQLKDGYSNISNYSKNAEGNGFTDYDIEIIGNIHEELL